MTTTTVTATDIEAAADRIRPHVRRTGLTISKPLSARHGATIAIKAEHTQFTGSFKLRGALNRVLTLSPTEARVGIVTASSGNHGIATATAARLADTGCTVYLPTGASPSKVAAIKAQGAIIVTVDSSDAFQAEVVARAAAAEEGATYVSPYNDPTVVAGQGTVGVEIAEDASSAGLERLDAVVVAVGGGGLISGIATWLADRSPDTIVIGASPAHDAAMADSVEAGRVVNRPAKPTYSDGTAGGIEPETITFEPCQSLVDQWVLVSEAEIAAAVATMIDDHHQLIEGAAGVALAAGTRFGERHPGSSVVVVTCGANVSAARLGEMLSLAGSFGGAKPGEDGHA
ncbi:MAG: threonine/serine dehydratase [Actinomycetia bacterium]|nr:threonine/serine dehydratase [Actinomycetes bacterium]MCP5035934.1 threonine/serine dehydratase [Actinomycetes bacterium]